MNIEEKRKFAEILEYLRGDKSKRDFAKLVGVSNTIISKWLKCETEPSYESLEKIAKLRGQSLTEFMNDLQQKPLDENQEPFEKLIERLPYVIKVIDDIQLALLMEAIAKGLKLR